MIILSLIFDHYKNVHVFEHTDQSIFKIKFFNVNQLSK